MSIDKIKVLEDRVTQVMEYIMKLQAERIELEKGLQEKETIIKDLEEQVASYKKVEDDFSKMKDERGEVRSRIEKILDSLKGVGGGGQPVE
ncbi:MAG: cell division protein ZapB [Nitrospirae bacterium]|nr:cell division protein ZapB [Nitrospirota bacterium]